MNSVESITCPVSAKLEPDVSFDLVTT